MLSSPSVPTRRSSDLACVDWRVGRGRRRAPQTLGHNCLITNARASVSWIPVKHLPIAQDLSGLSRYLHSKGLVHRITDEGDRQTLWVSHPAIAPTIAVLADRWLAGDLMQGGADSRVQAASAPSVR